MLKKRFWFVLPARMWSTRNTLSNKTCPNEIADERSAQSRAHDVQGAFLPVVLVGSETELENGLVGDQRGCSALRERDVAAAVCNTKAKKGVVKVVRREGGHAAHVNALHGGEHVDNLRVTIEHVARDLLQSQSCCWVDVEPEW